MLQIANIATLAVLATFLAFTSSQGQGKGSGSSPPQNDANLLKLLSLEWPRKDSEDYLRAFAEDNALELLGRSFRDIQENLLRKPANKPNKDKLTAFGNKHQINQVVSALAKEGSKKVKSEGQKSVQFGKNALQQKLDNDKVIAENPANLLPNNSPASKHQRGFQKTDPLSTILAKQGFITEKATKQFRDSLNLPEDVSGLEFLPSDAATTCDDASLQRPSPSPCNNTERYRRLDGSCNNLQKPLWGASFVPFRRDLLPQYGDGISSLRVAASGLPLPSARLVSTSINVKPNTESSTFSILHMTYGQFIDHDLTSTPVSLLSHPIYGNVNVKCCFDSPNFCQRSSRIEEGEKDIPEERQFTVFSPECAPIAIPAGDKFYCRFRQSCIEFVRSAPAARCTLGPREQTNQLTAYLDGSVIYGSSLTSTLRANAEGLLSSQLTQDNVELLPPSTDLNDGCNVAEQANQNRFCFVAGDRRVNEQRLLTLFQTVWAREHNRISRQLKRINPNWSDEKLFQEAKRIVVAELQQVTYREYLPTVIGPWLPSQLNLLPLEGPKFTTDYDPDINPGIANAFAAAAYRFGHTEIADSLQRISRNGSSGADELSTLFFNPFELYKKDAIGDLARGVLSQPARNVDPFFTEQVTNLLFRGSSSFGLDLVSLNIQRGRDHGLPGYNTWREFCELSKATSFSDLSADIDAEKLQNLQRVYSHVDDIDLFIGGLSERPLTGGLLGPTLTCIITDQFVRIKRGDRYWFESQDLPGGAFTTPQMVSLHKVTLGKILCDNIPELETIQREPLKQISQTNDQRKCSDNAAFPSLNLQLWKE